MKIQSLQDYREFIKKNKSLMTSGQIILLSGEVGAGKTEFVKALVEVLHQKKTVQSPTFSLHHHYDGDPAIEHWDLYRLENEDDLESAGFWDQFSDSSSLIIVEWPERLKKEWIPAAWKQTHFEIIKVDDTEREIKQL